MNEKLLIFQSINTMLQYYIQFTDKSTYQIRPKIWNYLLRNFKEFERIGNIISTNYSKYEFEPYIIYLNTKIYNINTIHLVNKVAIAINDKHTLGKLWHQFLKQDIDYYIENDYVHPFSYLFKTNTNNTNTLNKHLQTACKYNSIQCMKILLKTDIMIDCRDYNLCTPLHNACLHNNLDCVKLLLEHGAKIDVQNKTDNTALHYASRNNNVDCIKLLLEYGAKIDIKDYNGRTALHCAYINNNAICVELLIKAGSNIQIKDKYDRTPLDYKNLEYLNNIDYAGIYNKVVCNK